MAVEYAVEWDPKALKELRKLDGTTRLQFLESSKNGRPGLECREMRFTA